MSLSKPIVDVVILSHTTLAIHPILCRAIDTLIDSEESISFNIIVVESNETANYKYNDNVNVVFPQGEFNYNKSVNCGLKLCSKDSGWVAVCNNDVEFCKGWFSEILKVKSQNLNIKSFSPLTIFHPCHNIFNNGTEAFYEGYDVSVHICGWCLVLEKDILGHIKDLFDEQFAFWYQDDNYAKCLIKHNIKHALVKDSLVIHLGSRSHDLLKDREEMTHGQAAKFLEKWK